MLDVRLFSNPRFTAACAAVTVSFFTLLGFIFVMTQYFQFIKHYDALSAGVHLLPVALSVGVSSVLGTKLAVRFGTKIVVTSGLLMVTAFYLWVAVIVAPGNAYSTIAIQMVLYGTGMGLTSAPATEAIMGVVPREKAGVGSAVNDTTRLLGGTLGVAVIGSVYASLYGSHLSSSLAGSPPPRSRRARPLIRRRRARRRRTSRRRGTRGARPRCRTRRHRRVHQGPQRRLPGGGGRRRASARSPRRCCCPRNRSSLPDPAIAERPGVDAVPHGGGLR